MRHIKKFLIPTLFLFLIVFSLQARADTFGFNNNGTSWRTTGYNSSRCTIYNFTATSGTATSLEARVYGDGRPAGMNCMMALYNTSNPTTLSNLILNTSSLNVYSASATLAARVFTIPSTTIYAREYGLCMICDTGGNLYFRTTTDATAKTAGNSGTYGYTWPANYSSQFNTAYNYTHWLNYSTSATTCTCPTTNTNWVVNLAEACNLPACDIGTGNLTFTGTGSATLAGTINITRFDTNTFPYGSTFYIPLGYNLNLRKGT